MINGILNWKKRIDLEKGSPASMKLSIFSKKSTARKIQMTVTRIMLKYLKISLVKYLEIIDIIKVVSVHGTLKLENRNWQFGFHALKPFTVIGSKFTVFPMNDATTKAFGY